MNKKLRLTLTIIIIIFLLGIVFYPKYKPLITKKLKGDRGAQAPMRQQQQNLNVAGYLIVPTTMSELINQTGTLNPDEEVNLSFETSGKIVKINFTEGTRVRKGAVFSVLAGNTAGLGIGIG